MDALLDSFSAAEHTYNNVCARAILLMFYWTGMRVSELTGLDDSSVDFVSCNVKVAGKGNKHRLVPFGRELKECLEKYIAVRDACVTRIESVKKLLGHSSVATTEVYTHVTFEKLKEAYEAAHPRS